MRNTRVALAVLAVVSVVYVSLLPYEFQAPAVPLGFGDFRSLQFNGWTSIIREDGLAHLLAYAVLAFLVRSALGFSLDNAWIDAGRDMLAWAVCGVLAVGLELAQQYLPARGVSPGDLVAGRSVSARVNANRR